VLAQAPSVSQPRSSNRTCGFPASRLSDWLHRRLTKRPHLADLGGEIPPMVRTPVSWKTGGCLAWTPCAAVSESAVPALQRTRQAPDTPVPCSPVQSMLSSLSVSDSAGPVLLSPGRLLPGVRCSPTFRFILLTLFFDGLYPMYFPASPPAESAARMYNPRKIESLLPCIPEARLLFVQCQFQPLQHPARPSQMPLPLCRG